MWITLSRAEPVMMHLPVLASAAVAALAPRRGGLYIDGTFGGGGYTRLLLAEPECRVIALDRDPDAASRARELARAEPRLTVVEAPFSSLQSVLAELGHPAVDGIVLDLGVSSYQLDDPARGFSFRHAGPLDMRMDRQGPSAADLVNGLTEGELVRLLREHGDEPDARRIARAIVAERARQPILTTDALAALVARVKGRHGARDPATLTFQALRIAVNDEAGELTRGLEAAEAVLRPGARLVVVAFHSGEDAAVKRFIDARGGRNEGGNRHLPPGRQVPPRWRWLSRRATMPEADERNRNPRARSARLRVAERLGPADDGSDTGGGAWRLAA
jgi:16S rRNA (cytosine1402-N4)-methyltransferase